VPTSKPSVPKWIPLATIAIVAATFAVAIVVRSNDETDPDAESSIVRNGAMPANQGDRGPISPPVTGADPAAMTEAMAPAASPTRPPPDGVRRVVLLGDETLSVAGTDVIDAASAWAVRVDAAAGRRLADIEAAIPSLVSSQPEVLILVAGRHDAADGSTTAANELADIAARLSDLECVLWVEVPNSSAEHEALNNAIAAVLAGTANGHVVGWSEYAFGPGLSTSAGDLTRAGAEAYAAMLVAAVDVYCP